MVYRSPAISNRIQVRLVVVVVIKRREKKREKWESQRHETRGREVMSVEREAPNLSFSQKHVDCSNKRAVSPGKGGMVSNNRL